MPHLSAKYSHSGIVKNVEVAILLHCWLHALVTWLCRQHKGSKGRNHHISVFDSVASSTDSSYIPSQCLVSGKGQSVTWTVEPVHPRSFAIVF